MADLFDGVPDERPAEILDNEQVPSEAIVNSFDVLLEILRGANFENELFRAWFTDWGNVSPYVNRAVIWLGR